MRNMGVLLETADIQNFLTAEVGMGASGERLTVAVALSRLGFDPILEAERLSAMSRASACQDLAKLIAGTPGSTWDFDAAITISDHLVRLLPVHLPLGGA